MSEWAITDLKADRILGTVDAANEVEAAARADLGQAEWFWRSEPGPHDRLSAHAVVTLTERWRELGPGEPLPAGQVGGDGQDSEAFSRRFARVRGDGSWAVLTCDGYVFSEPRRLGRPEGEIWVEIQEEHMIAADVHDLGGTEIWSDTRYHRAVGYPVSEAGARQALAEIDVTEIDWDGEVF